MSAEILRRAAALMRERAEAATPGPWECYGDHLVWPNNKGPAANDPILGMIGADHDDCAEHIASWHPAVALAVAELLEQHAEQHSSSACRNECVWNGDACKALAVARVYLGGDS